MFKIMGLVFALIAIPLLHADNKRIEEELKRSFDE
nr:MAG TPA: Nematode cuticle collagen N-terminal domain [Caudoviricetes sp.]